MEEDEKLTETELREEVGRLKEKLLSSVTFPRTAIWSVVIIAAVVLFYIFGDFLNIVFVACSIVVVLFYASVLFPKLAKSLKAIDAENDPFDDLAAKLKQEKKGYRFMNRFGIIAGVLLCIVYLVFPLKSVSLEWSDLLVIPIVALLFFIFRSKIRFEDEYSDKRFNDLILEIENFQQTDL